MHWPTFVFTFIAAGLVVLGLSGLRTRDGGLAAEGDLPRDRALAILLFAMLLRLCLQSVLGRDGLLHCTMDEPIRWSFAYMWSRSPFFFTWDGIWLTGHFAFWGMLCRIFNLNKMLGLQLGILACHFFTIGTGYYLTWVIGRRRWPAAVAALLIAVGYPFLWMGEGPLVETMLAGCFMLALAWIWRFCESLEAAPALRRRYALGGAAFILAATSLHYVGWMAVAAGMPFLLAYLFLHRRRIDPRGWQEVAVIVLAAGLFPVAWIAFSWIKLGHPLQFLANQAKMNEVTNKGVHQAFGGPLGNLMLYPRSLFGQVGSLAPLGLVALARAWRGPVARPLRVFIGLILAQLAVMMASSLSGGVSITFFRSTIILYTLLLCLFSLAAAPALTHFWTGGLTLGRRWLLPAALGLTLVGWAGFNGVMGFRCEESMPEKVPHDLIALGAWLRQEARLPQTLKPFGPKTRVATRGGFTYCYLQYASGRPENFYSVAKEKWTTETLTRYDYIMAQDKDVPKGWRRLTQIGQWNIYQRQKNERKNK